MPEYHDIEGRVQRASDDSRRAILSALGFDVSSSAAERDALDAMIREELDELVAPVRVVRRSSSPHAHLDVRVPTGRDRRRPWRVTLDLEKAASDTSPKVPTPTRLRCRSRFQSDAADRVSPRSRRAGVRRRRVEQ